MQTTNPKRLIEVDLPIKKISAHARREKNTRHGHISTLHIWWARRPLAACRAVICAALWPDPVDENCPQPFREAAARELSWFADRTQQDTALGNSCSTDTFGKWTAISKSGGQLDASNAEHWNVLRFLLLDFIADFANWDNSTRSEYLTVSQRLTQVANEALGGVPGTKPLVVDPFAGGGAIPLEALRVGADAFASDLNPVAVLLNKVVLEYIPKHGNRLADEVRKWGQWVKEQTERELAEFYPKDPDGARPIAYLWARTITCEGPGCGTQVPLLRALWLTKKSSYSVALKIEPNIREHRVEFDVKQGATLTEVGEGTIRRSSATCPCCRYTTPAASVRRQLKSRRGGSTDARLVAIVTARDGDNRRRYRLPTGHDLRVVEEASRELERRKKATISGGLPLTPQEPTPPGGGRGAGRAFSQRNYGMDRFEDLFTSRQLLVLSTLARYIREAELRISEQTAPDLAEAVQVALAMTLDKQADYLSSLCTWHYHNREKVNHTFARQAIPFISDFVETVYSGSGSGNWNSLLEWTVMAINAGASVASKGTAVQASARHHPLPNDSAQAFITDPPYYDAVPYADLSDFFYVWLKRTLPKTVGCTFDDAISPKDEECIMDEEKGKDRTYFERTMQDAMAEGRRILAPNGVGIVVFAHKSTTGWEAQLQAMVDAGWTITGSWPLDTEMGTRLRARDSAALASSVHLVCRPRENSDGSLRADAIGDWRDVLAELPQRIHEWMPRLAREGVVGADAIFACLGPALEVFSRYSRVEKASGEQVTLREYLEHVWAAVAKEALAMVFSGADATGFEADARLTAIWFWTLSAGDSAVAGASEDSEPDEEAAKSGTTSGFALEFDDAMHLAQGLGAHLERLPAVVEVKGDKARLLSVRERTRYLFGKDGGPPGESAKKRDMQLNLFGGKAEQEEAGVSGPGLEERISFTTGSTVLDRVHQAMLLFGSGRGEAMRRFLVEEGAGNDQRFWRLAQALSALYPAQSDEKRWVDGVLARKKGLGF